MIRTILSLLLIASSATAFVTNANSMRTLAMQLQGQQMAFEDKLAMLSTGREFQLEEKEDRDVEQTRIWLNPDGTVTLQDTDGPQFINYQGRWSMVNEEGCPFRMLLDRVYGGGMKAAHATAMGEFDYTVRREFMGDLNMIGSTVNVEGAVHLLDDNGAQGFEVGYFALIDSRTDLE